jgi:hypothetical protein
MYLSRDEVERLIGKKRYCANSVAQGQGLKVRR